jgi:hypothetical protein
MLPSDPIAPEYLQSGTQEERAARTSSRTHGSSSTARRRASPAATEVMSGPETPGPEPIRPSAHAACPRTSGSSSSSAVTNDGTASGDPQFPSATATLRSSPRRLARLIGEFLKRRENSAWSIAIHSISDGPSSPARVRNASSSAGVANEFHGHTSWEDCRLPRYVIELETGRRTVLQDR